MMTSKPALRTAAARAAGAKCGPRGSEMGGKIKQTFITNKRIQRAIFLLLFILCQRAFYVALHGCEGIHRKCEKPVENLALKSRKRASNKGNKHFAQFLST